MKLICQICGLEFEGFATRKTCSLACRKTLSAPLDRERGRRARERHKDRERERYRRWREKLGVDGLRTYRRSNPKYEMYQTRESERAKMARLAYRVLKELGINLEDYNAR